MKNRKNKTIIPMMLLAGAGTLFGELVYKNRKEKHPVEKREVEMKQESRSLYETHIKRIVDVVCALLAIIVFGWLYIIVALLVRIKLGTPILFTQLRPGKHEKIFKMYKFRTMTDERDENGDLLPDDIRLTKFGKKLRSTSLDELPEVFNILKGDMSVVGPRPQLVRDMVFMTDEQRERHLVKPGLSGLAQINGRNNIDWGEKLKWDLKYIEKVSFCRDVKIIIQTVLKAFIKHEGITEGDMATARDLGDYLLEIGKITEEEYEKKQEEAVMILENISKEEQRKRRKK